MMYDFNKSKEFKEEKKEENYVYYRNTRTGHLYRENIETNIQEIHRPHEHWYELRTPSELKRGEK